MALGSLFMGKYRFQEIKKKKKNGRGKLKLHKETHLINLFKSLPLIQE